MPKLAYSEEVWPLKVFFKKAESILEIEFDNGEIFYYTAEYLRIESPSAEVKGHGTMQKRILSGCKHVVINEIEPVGNYAIRLHFSDGHNNLHTLGQNHASNWARYLQMLEALGLSREI
jgi:DUF971 family protein